MISSKFSDPDRKIDDPDRKKNTWVKNSFLSFYKKYCFFALSISTASVLYKISSMINMMNHPKTKDFYVDFTFMDKFKTLMEGSDGYYLIVGFILVIASLIFFKKQNKYFKN